MGIDFKKKILTKAGKNGIPAQTINFPANCGKTDVNTDNPATFRRNIRRDISSAILHAGAHSPVRSFMLCGKEHGELMMEAV